MDMREHNYNNWMFREEKPIPPTQLYKILDNLYGEERAKEKFKELMKIREEHKEDKGFAL